MRRAIRLLTICFMISTLLAAAAVWAAADAPEAEAPAAVEEDAAEAEAQTDAPETGSETEAPADPLAPVDVPAGGTAGTVYAVGSGGSIAVTVVDYAAGGENAGVCLESGDYYYYGAQITGADAGVVIDGAASGYFGSSDGSIPLYDAKGAVSGIVWGGCHPTAADCGVGFLLRGDAGTILAEDGASLTCRDAVILCSAGSGSFRFRNARLSSESGILLQTEPDAGDVSLTLENGFYSGDLINGGGSLDVTVGQGALLFGDTAQLDGPIGMTVSTGAAWIPDERATLTRLTVEDGATVYGEVLEAGGGILILFPSDQLLEPGTYEAEPLTENLPAGHGPALPAGDDPASEQDGEEPSAPDMDADRAKKLFPLVPSAVDPENAPAEEPQDVSPSPAPTEAADSTPAPSEAPDDVPAPTEAPAPTPAPSEVPDASPAPSETPAAALPEPDHATLGHSLLLGAGVASPSALGASVGTFQPSLDLAARLAVRTTGQPPAASLLKTGAKSHSFLPQTLDNQAIILYNPYCCSAA